MASYNIQIQKDNYISNFISDHLKAMISLLPIGQDFDFATRTKLIDTSVKLPLYTDSRPIASYATISMEDARIGNNCVDLDSVLPLDKVPASPTLASTHSQRRPLHPVSIEPHALNI
jgi:hypothetical protein